MNSYRYKLFKNLHHYARLSTSYIYILHPSLPAVCAWIHTKLALRWFFLILISPERSSLPSGYMIRNVILQRAHLSSVKPRYNLGSHVPIPCDLVDFEAGWKGNNVVHGSDRIDKITANIWRNKNTSLFTENSPSPIPKKEWW
jgi:hypothetical protein